MILYYEISIILTFTAKYFEYFSDLIQQIIKMFVYELITKTIV